MATKPRQFLGRGFRRRRPTERTRLEAELVMACTADPFAAADLHGGAHVHVPVVEADWAPRPEALRRRLRLRVRLAPRAGGLVLGFDARADLVGLRPRRGAVDRERRRGRRRLGPRPLVPDLLARLAVTPLAPVDALALGRTVPAPGVASRASAPPPNPLRASCERAAPDPFTSPGAHCVVSQGQLSLAFSPQMVQVRRRRRALARAFLCSYSRCLTCHSISPGVLGGSIVSVARDNRLSQLY